MKEKEKLDIFWTYILIDVLDPYCDPVVKTKKLHIEGLSVNRWSDWTQGLEQMKEWVLQVSLYICIISRLKKCSLFIDLHLSKQFS